MKIVGVVALGAALLITPSAIAGPPMYAHKAGVTKEALEVDETACLTDAKRAMNDPKFTPAYSYNPVTQGTVAGAAGSALAYGFMAGIASAKRFNTTLYDCLISRGYTMRRVSPEDWKALKKLPKDEQIEKMRAWRSLAEPLHPEVLRDKID